jgi:branched-chain amino acid transport system ATP-binding protein
MLKLAGITGGYGNTTVLHDVSVAVGAGSVTALIGPNGAGKTTTLKTASGLLRPRRGQVLLDGEDVTARSAAARVGRGLCHLTENRGVFPSLTVRENMVLFAPKGKEEEAFDQAASAFPILARRRRQAAGTLSGGEQQMLALARAYVSSPRIVLVDEASFGLAPIIVEEIFAFLERLAAEGIALLLVEQYVSRALALADRVYVMHKGEIVFAGLPSDLDENRLFALYAGEAA